MADYVEITALVPASHIPSTAGAIYTGHDTRKTKITAVTITEQAGGTQNLDMWFVPDGGARGIDNRIVNTLGFTANENKSGLVTEELSALVGAVLPAGTDIHAQASASATALTIHISGVIFEDPS